MAAVALLALAASAHAAPLTYTGYSVLNSQNVELKQDIIRLDEWAGSGQITLTGTNTPGGLLAVWCVDLYHFLQPAGGFASSYVMTGPAANAVNALVTNGTPTLSGDADASSALQIAIWKSVIGPELQVYPAGPNTALAETFLDDVARGAWLPDPHMQVTVLTGAGLNRDQAYLTPVYEPGSVSLLGAGLLVIPLLRRRASGGGVSRTS